MPAWCFLGAVIIAYIEFQGIQASEPKFRCEEGWTQFGNIINRNCLFISNDSQSYDQARRACNRHSGNLVTILSSAMENVIVDEGEDATDYWIGLHRPKGRYKSFVWASDAEPSYENWSPSHGSFYSSSNSRCVFFTGTFWKSTYSCRILKKFVCETKAGCTEGLFGPDCEKQCHCQGVTCDWRVGRCEYGCQLGWMGAKCDQKKKKADVAYYCFNSKVGGRYMLIRFDPLGVSYEEINGLTNDGNLAKDCGISSFRLNNGVYNRVVNMSTGDVKGNCGAKETQENKWQWRFRLSEKKGVLSETDEIVQARCDFSKAETQVRQAGQYVEGKVQAEVKEVEEVREEVSLDVVDAYSQVAVTRVQLGTNVKLRLGLVAQTGASAKGVSAFDCEAFSSDGSTRVALTDHMGCSVPNSPVSRMIQFNSSVQSDIFPIFTFPLSSTVNFRCKFEFCFDQQDSKCRDRCPYNQHRSRRFVRRSSGSADQTRKPVYTSVEVIRGDKTEESVQETSRGGSAQALPLLYLNPITCSMFVLLLTVFLLMYVVFIRSLKKSVNEMKADLSIHSRAAAVPLL